MVQIWYMDNMPSCDPRLPQHMFPPKMVTVDQIRTLLGVQYWKLNLDDITSTSVKQRIDAIRRERNYDHEDIQVIGENITSDFQEKLKVMYQEQKSEEDVARLVVDGYLYIDVQVPDTRKWIRILLSKGDFVVVPAGISHRFTTDTRNYVKTRRFFKRFDENVPSAKPVAAVNIHRESTAVKPAA